MGVSQVVNLLRIANDQLPSVQDRYEQLQKQNNQFESILRTKSKELQDLNSLIAETSKNLDTIKLEYKREAALVQDLQQQTARLETFVYNYKNNDEVYVKVLKSIENKVQDLISNKKAFLKLAIFSLIQSMRNNPDKYSSLVYHDNNNQNSLLSTSRNNSNVLEVKSSRQVILPPLPYDDYVIEDYKAIVLEEAEKLYNIPTDQLLCDIINESISKQSLEATPSLPKFYSDKDKQHQEPAAP